VSDRPIRVVLDTSAIVAYTHGSIDVGEVIAEVDDEVGAVALPVACLVEAHLVVADHDRLMVLARHPATVVLTVDPDDWTLVADLAHAGGRSDAATAALIAGDHGATVLTRQPDMYRTMSPDIPVIGF
jgi:hypothetical protein